MVRSPGSFDKLGRAMSTVDAIITHPPLSKERLPLFPDLADFAVHALRDTGVMVVMADGLVLPEVMDHLTRPDLIRICEFDYQSQRPQPVRKFPHQVTLHRRPLLFYGKRQFRLSGYDVIRLPSLGVPAVEGSTLRGHDAAMALVVRRFTQPGQVICDSFLLGRVVRHARKLVINLSRGHPSYALLGQARRRILALAHGPPGG